MFMYLFLPVCQKVLYCPVVQGHYKRGRKSDEVSKWRRRGLERSQSFQGRRLDRRDYAEGGGEEEIPPQDCQDVIVAFQLSQVNAASLQIPRLLLCLTFPLIRLLNDNRNIFFQNELRRGRLWGLLSDCQISGLHEAVCTELWYLFITGRICINMSECLYCVSSG